MAATREQIVQAAEKFVARGKIEPAIREYRKVLADHPNDINTLNRIGDLYARIQRIDEAVDFFTQIAEQYTAEGFFVKAIAIYKKILKLDPARMEAYEQVAELYHKQGLINEARTQYQVLADYYVRNENAASAIAIYQKMVQLEPENPTYHVKLAEIYHQQQLIEKAMGEYRVIAELMIQHGRPHEAAQVYERALDIDSQNLGFIEDAARRLRQADHVEGALHFLSVAVDRNPNAEPVSRKLREGGGFAAAPAAYEPPADLDAEMELLIEVEPEPAVQPPTLEPAAGPGAAPRMADPGLGAILDEDELTFDLGDEDELAKIMAEAASQVGGGPAAASASQEDEFELDLDDVLAVEIEGGEDEEPSTLFKPPADMLGAAARPAWSQEAAPRPGAAFAPPPAPPPAEAPEAEQEIELELELDDPFSSMSMDGWTTEPPPWLTAEPELDAEPEAAVEEPAAPAAAAPEPDDLESVTEAVVLARYGLENKAVERLEQALRQQPDHLQALALLIQFHLDQARQAEVLELANRMSEAAARRGQVEDWQKVRTKLADAGYRFDGERVLAPQAARPAAARPAAGKVDDLLKDLLKPAPRTPRPAAPPPAAPPPRPEPVLEELTFPEPELPETLFAEPGFAEPGFVAPAFSEPELLEPVFPDAGFAAPDVFAPPAPPPVEPPPPAPSRPASPRSVFDPLQIGELVESEAEDWSALDVPTPLPPEPAPPPESVAASMLDDTGSMSWLDEADRHREEKKGASAGIFEEEDDFFDLAGELVEELSREEVFQRDGVTIQSEQSLEDIVEGFKKGVAEHLSPTDYDTHFNLGIAYREMGLLDEAVGEFQLAAKDPSHLVLCCSMLGLCFLDKGLPDLAIKWYTRALAAPGISGEDQLGMLYDLGNVYLQVGDTASAYNTFAELYGFDANYRDVGEKLQELAAQ